jgi:hypothetical protein
MNTIIALSAVQVRVNFANPKLKVLFKEIEKIQGLMKKEIDENARIYWGIGYSELSEKIRSIAEEKYAFTEKEQFWINRVAIPCEPTK